MGTGEYSVSPKQRNALFFCFVLVISGLSLFFYYMTRSNSGSGAAQASEDTGVIDLPAGEKLVSGNVESDIAFGYLTRPMRPGETPETYKLRKEYRGDIIAEYTIRERANETPAQNQGRQPK